MIGRRCIRAVTALFALVFASLANITTAVAADEAIAASGPPLNLALFVNSSSFLCYNSGRVEATRKLAGLAVERINELGGIRGRRVDYKIYDNGNLPPLKKGASPEERQAHQDAAIQKAVDNARAALNQKDLLAMIGLSDDERARRVFELVAKDALEKKKIADGLRAERLNKERARRRAANENVPADTEIEPEVEPSPVPFISNISVGKTLKAYGNVFSTRPAQEVERVPVMVRFFKANNIKSVGILSRTGTTWARAIRSGLQLELDVDKQRTEAEAAAKAWAARARAIDENKIKAKLEPFKEQVITTIVSDRAVAIRRDYGNGRSARIDPAELEAAIAEIQEKRPQMLVVSVGTNFTAAVIERLKRAEYKPAIFMVGWLSPNLDKGWEDPKTRYPQPIFGIDWATVPEVESDRLFNILGQGEPEEWFFAGRKAASMEEWNRNDCNKFYATYVPSTFSAANIAAAKEGALFADMIKLVATSAASTGRTLDIGGTRSGNTTPIEKYRKAVLRDLGHKYAAGSGAFKGIFENWSFHPEQRVRAQTPIVAILPSGLGKKQLAQTQFIRLRDGGIKPIQTLYMDVDLVRTYSVDNNKKSFFAEFYLAMRRSDNFSIKDITFTNAFLDPRASRDALTNGRELTIDELHPGGKSDAYPSDMQMYKVAGRFRFKPDFSQYPFDTQQFSIDLQPRNSNKTFIIQPPPPNLRDQVVASEGWIPDKQYVSFVEDFVPVVDAFTHQPSIVPFYNARFVWQMKRETTDYYIRVVVPLLFILIVAYLSIFIPKTNLEAIVTIQVTALLAAVALYLSLPQIDTDSATISDQIFMFDYMMVSVMIVVSILRINAAVMKVPWINHLLAFVHIVIIPAVLLALVLYISKSELLAGFMDQPIWKLLRIG